MKAIHPPARLQDQYNQEFFSFLQSSPTAFHAVANMATRLRENGFRRLDPGQDWNLQEGDACFLTRDHGALIAFTIANHTNQNQGFRLLGAHCDSPALQIKPLSGKTAHSCFQLGVEVYGGPLLAPWFDRDLSIAGRVVCATAEDDLITLLLDFKRPVAVIPSLAIHFDREANTSHSINRQKDLPPLIGQLTGNNTLNFSTILTEQINKEYPRLRVQAIEGFDLFCYDCQPPALLGMNNEFITASRLDNLLSCFAGCTAICEAATMKKKTNSLLLCSNHEEIGSLSAAGARGSFLHSTLERILPNPIVRQQLLQASFFISMDNAHAVHPNFSDKSDPEHQPQLNNGPVIKTNANHNYTTSSISKAIFRLIAAEAGVATQDFVMRSDLGCGSTIGPHISAQLGIPAVDIGAPTLAMHSIRELTGSSDPFQLYRTTHHFLTRRQLPSIKDHTC